MGTLVRYSAAAFATALLIADAPHAHSGYNYNINHDKFTGNTIITYNLSVGEECRLTKSIKSSINICKFLHIRQERRTPSLLLYTLANEWEILYYKKGWPNQDGTAPVLVTYKNGSTKRYYLPTSYNGDVIRGNIVQERIGVELGSIRDQLPQISHFEIQYGSIEYYFKLDPVVLEEL
jgi:hypothetical protein